MGFEEKLVNWIKICVSPRTFSILVNESSTKVCYPTRGLKQGHHSSSHWWWRVNLWFKKQIWYDVVMHCFKQFRLFTELEISQQKSNIFIFKSCSNLSALARFTAFQLGSLPNRFLGLLLNSKSLSFSDWYGLNILWQKNSLSYAGRLHLLKWKKNR